MAATATPPLSVQCPRCFAVIEGRVLMCPLCLTLIHSAGLSEIKESADAAEARQDWSEALRLWRSALDLLPQNTAQYQFVEGKVRELSAKVDREEDLPSHPRPGWAKRFGPWAGAAILLWKLKSVLLVLLGKWKLLLFGFSKITTVGSMALSFVSYAGQLGWKYALGLVLSIYVHEMGHVHAARRFGLNVSAPVFIPFVGAFILLKQHPVTRQEDARISLAGPVWGMWAAVFSYVLHFATGNQLLGAVAHSAAVMNLFNLLPVPPLDGSGAFRSFTRPFRIAATAGLALIWVFLRHGLLLALLPFAIWQCCRKDCAVDEDRKALIGYLSLTVALTWMAVLK